MSQHQISIYQKSAQIASSYISRSLDKTHLRSVRLDSKLMPCNVNTLYPYDSIELVVLFIYGQNFKRQQEVFIIPESIKIVGILFAVFVSLAAIILCFIRHKLKLRRNGLFATCIDTMVAFIAGGTLQMRHKLERLFFGILLISALFMTALWTGDLLDCMYQNMDQKITTFKQLADINAPIFCPTSLKERNILIHEMLRYEMIIFRPTTILNENFCCI